MLRILFCFVLVAAVHASLLHASSRRSFVSAAAATLGVVVGWFVLVFFAARGATHLGFSQELLICGGVMTANTIAALNPNRTARLVGTASGIAGCGWLMLTAGADRAVESTMAVILLVAAMASVALSARKTKNARSLDVDTPRFSMAVISSALLSLATVSLFSRFVQTGLDPTPESDWLARVVIIATAAATMGVVALLEIGRDSAPATGPLTVIAAVLFVIAIGQEAVMPASCFAAAILLGPLVTTAEQQQTLADEHADQTTGTGDDREEAVA